MKIGDKALDFSLKDTDGKTVSLSDISQSGPFVIVFSCNHCPYVLAWEDRLIELGREYKSRGVSFVLINANDSAKYPADSPEEMAKRAKLKGYPFAYLHDETQKVARAYGAERTPEVFMFDHLGTLTYHGAPDDNYEDADSVRNRYLRDALEAELEDRKPSIAESQPVGCTIKWK